MPFNPFGEGIFKMLGPEIHNKSIIKLKRSKGVLTETEIKALNLLEKIVKTSSYRIFTQVHLLQIFDVDKEIIKDALKINHVLEELKYPHEEKLVKYWRHQLGFKSVDFLVCNSITTQVIFGVEIDDPTHNDVQRKQWDEIKNTIFKGAKIPLLRFTNQQINYFSDNKKHKEFYELAIDKMNESKCSIVDFHEKNNSF
ncbi:DUF2726 domain-containing protein [Pantoea agglomerans]|uniref:DUF2726 domain-containing protein n=1 Tax=Enterobacter agglomerans TaxID=549 RepID=UPI00045C3514|nr:DUF2726 domain-containing protein [Pantoea agglomerans]KDA94309.1 hypothetical protein T296_11705 [Pantoea agglomerans Eh318]NQS79423.1 DUF2726 domain-containing protein [Pantoea agglomerans]